MVKVRVSEAFPLESYAGHAGTVLGETNGLLVIRIDGQPSFLALTLTADYVNEVNHPPDKSGGFSEKIP